MPINDDEARFLLDKIKSELEESSDTLSPPTDHFLHRGAAGGISFIIEYCGPDWAKGECEKLWEAESKK